MSEQTFYAVGALHRSIGVSLLGLEQSVPLVWEEGMVGCLPVFSSREAAEKEAGDKYDVLEFVAEVQHNL